MLELLLGWKLRLQVEEKHPHAKPRGTHCLLHRQSVDTRPAWCLVFCPCPLPHHRLGAYPGPTVRPVRIHRLFLQCRGHRGAQLLADSKRR